VVGRNKAGPAQRYEAAFRSALLRKLNYMELFDADILPESRPGALSIAYISLNLQAVGEGDGVEEPLPTEAVLNNLHRKAGRLLIRADAGSGKCTLFRCGALQAAAPDSAHPTAAAAGGLDAFPAPAKEHGRPAADWRERVPFRIRLRDHRDLLARPDGLPERIAPEAGKAPVKWFTTILR
jgi:hypothetical protein